MPHVAFQRSAGSSAEVPLLNMDGSLMEENELMSVCMGGPACAPEGAYATSA